MSTAGISAIAIDAALADPKLLGAALGDPESWRAWIAILRAAFGQTLNADDAALFSEVSGGRTPPAHRVRELWAIVGRRSGKSRMAAAIAVYLATFIDHTGRLSPGETGYVLVLAASKAQARTVFDYCRGFFEESPILRQQVEDITADEIRLHGGITIAVHTNNYRTVRGRTLLACVFDEVAFWRDESTSLPDVETYRAILPALATTGGMMVGISSPYAQRGLIYSKSQASFGKPDDDVLVVRSDSMRLNPTLDAAIIEAARREDPESARSEWDGEFRNDLAAFVDRAVVERCVDSGVHERPFLRQHRYVAFCDPSGGQHDSMTLGIAHREGARVVLDVTREVRAPFEPPVVVSEFARLLNSYRIVTVRGDRYASAWVSEAFRAHGINYMPSDRSRSEIYLDALPLLMADTALLLDDDRLVAQLSQLERRTTRGGRDSVDHMRGAADDLANAAAGALVHVPTEARASWRPPVRLEGMSTYRPFQSIRPVKEAST